MTKFEIGKTYWTRSICDSDCIHSITVVSRTAQTIKTACGKTLRTTPPKWEPDVEQVKPFGTYSMCAIITAQDRGPIPEPRVDEPRRRPEPEPVVYVPRLRLVVDNTLQ